MEVDFEVFKKQCNETEEFEGKHVCDLMPDDILCSEENCPYNKKNGV